MKIICENKLCIYFENSFCVLDSILLDIMSFCTDGIHVDIEEKFLALERKKLREEFQRLDDMRDYL